MKCAKRSCPFPAVYGNYCQQHRGRKGGGSVGITNSGYNLIIIDEFGSIRGRKLSNKVFEKLSSNIYSVDSINKKSAKKTFKVVINIGLKFENHYNIVEELTNRDVVYISKKRVFKTNAK